MELINFKNIDQLLINELKVSALICATGYESRCTHVAKSFSHLKCNKYVLAFSSFIRNTQRKANDQFFKDSNFEFIQTKEDDATEIVSLINFILANHEGNICTIIFDYSSMTRIWYGGLLQYLKLKEGYNKIIKILFCYSFSKYSPPQPSSNYNKYVGPIKGFFNLNIPDKPTALLLGLGYEKGRAYGLKEYLDAETYVFYTQPEKNNEQFSIDVEAYNKDIFLKLRKDHIIKYPITNLEYTINLVYTVCADLIDDFRLILAPCGPKPFTLACLITSIKLGNIDVWRISTGVEKAYKREASGEISILDCSFAPSHYNN